MLISLEFRRTQSQAKGKHLCASHRQSHDRCPVEKLAGTLKVPNPDEYFMLIYFVQRIVQNRSELDSKPAKPVEPKGSIEQAAP